jgi:thiol:disulfide interchange protein DsbD
MYKIVTFLLLLALNAFALTPNAEVHVKMSATALGLNDNPYLVISLKNDELWHTYWKNPGDAGLPIKFEIFEDGKKKDFKPLNWPAPKKYLEAGNMMAYGYSGTNHFFYELPRNFYNKELEIKGTWLVCKDICIPGQASTKIKLGIAGWGQNHSFKITDKEIGTTFIKLPKVKETPQNLEIYLTKAKEENKLAIQYTLSNLDFKNFDIKSNLLTPYLQPPFDFKHEKLYFDRQNNTIYGRMYVDWDGEYEEPQWPLPKNGIFKKPIQAKFLVQFDKSKAPIVIKHSFTQFALTGDESMESFFKTLQPVSEATKEISANTENTDQSLLYFILFAFIGGLILNLMPCVLPVISLKLFGLIAHSDEDKSKILKHNLAYTAGVISSFMALGAIILLLKSSGEKIGWGFQLQSPGFVFAMMIILLVMAFNMLGLFEFVTPGGKSLGNAQIKKGMMGDFVNGILATILSTPCSAPFLGTALTFAFTTGPSSIFIIFFFVGLGLSFPFILTGFFPKLISFLPKPGMWMEKLKNILGFTLLLTFVWLYDVLANIINFNASGIYLNTIFTLIFMAFFFRRFITKIFFWNILFFALPVALTVNLISNDGLKVDYGTDTKVEKTNDQTWNKWSQESMDKLKADKKWVFIDFTAKWCLTCKVNKKLVFETDSFSKFVKENKVELLIADWTKRDDYITDFLNKYKIVGVPAYFLQKPNGENIHLGETISIGKIKENMK